MSIVTYSPESVKITVEGKELEGFEQEDFLSGDDHKFTIKLHFGSASIGPLKHYRSRPAKVEVVSGITRGAFIAGEYFEATNKLKHLDFSGNYAIDGPRFNYSTDSLKVEFTFTKI